MKWNNQGDDGPLTIARLGGHLIVVSCNRCPNRRSLRGDELNLPGDTLVDDVCRFLKCSKCGSRDVLTPDPAARS